MRNVPTLRSRPHFPELGESASDFRAAITLVPQPIIITRMGTIGDRTTLIPNHIRITTVATDTAGITGVELTTAIIAIIIATAIELTSLSELWK